MLFVLISFNIKVLLILQSVKCTRHSGKNADFIGFAIFSADGHFEFSTRLNFTILTTWNLIILHVELRFMDAVVLKA